MSFTLINNSIDNSIISHVQLCPTSLDAWNELIKLFESQDVVTKMYLKNELHTLKMKENENMTKHTEQLSTIGSLLLNDEDVNTQYASKLQKFISSMHRQQPLSLQSLITYLIQEETLMKSLNSSTYRMSTVYVGKRNFNINRNQKRYFPSKDGEGHLIKIDFNNSKMKCFFCKKLGHHIKDYKARITKDSRNSTRQTNVAINLTSCILQLCS